MAGARTGHAVSETKRRSAMPTSDSSVTTSWRRWVDLGFYMLVPLLRREAETVDLTIRLVSEHAPTRAHRTIFKEVHVRLFEIWEKYEDDDMTTTQPLRVCSHIIRAAMIHQQLDSNRFRCQTLRYRFFRFDSSSNLVLSYIHSYASKLTVQM
ncbi:hypothetical protein DPMN_105957 [Dreissena polymorpha]|uniref:Uncharacterized protein n=1 Tax=Dreissena polymorpha TaxID=45954 RepID=A0A9D4K473_DREPO|nr:hypothetical protein DPMN_105951 [Dreissena polymorpha]KAH3832665.1 hypothetical protein DPMN_105957 [Dreissena polymorpha]